MRNQKVLRMAQLAILTAILILFAVTPIGYLKIGPVEITFMLIPVAVGAICLGPAEGAFLGAVFGVTSFLQGFLGISAFGVALFSISRLWFPVLCILPRILCGLVPGILHRVLPKGMPETARCMISALSCALTNTIGFVGLMMVFFGNSDYISGMRGEMALLPFLAAFVGINGLVEAIVSTVVGGGIARVIPAIGRHTKQ